MIQILWWQLDAVGFVLGCATLALFAAFGYRRNPQLLVMAAAMTMATVAWFARYAMNMPVPF